MKKQIDRVLPMFQSVLEMFDPANLERELSREKLLNDLR
jgi:hypothetical protein